MPTEPRLWRCVWWRGSKCADQGQSCKAAVLGSLPAVAGAQAAAAVQPQNNIWKTAGKDNELHWPVSFHPSQCVLHGRCRNKSEF